jgi:hypothetical protein
VKKCPECRRIAAVEGEPVDSRVVTEASEPCGNCREGVEDRDTPL